MGAGRDGDFSDLCRVPEVGEGAGWCMYVGSRCGELGSFRCGEAAASNVSENPGVCKGKGIWVNVREVLGVRNHVFVETPGV